MTTHNPLEAYPKIRDGLYLAQWVFNGVMGAVAVVLLTLGENPQWFVLVTAVANFVWSYVGLTAKRNVPTYPEFEDVEFLMYEDAAEQ